MADNLADTKIPNAAQFAKEAKQAHEDLVRQLKALELRKHSMDIVVRLAEHTAVNDPVSLARHIYRFLETGFETQEPDA